MTLSLTTPQEHYSEYSQVSMTKECTISRIIPASEEGKKDTTTRAASQNPNLMLVEQHGLHLAQEGTNEDPWTLGGIQSQNKSSINSARIE